MAPGRSKKQDSIGSKPKSKIPVLALAEKSSEIGGNYLLKDDEKKEEEKIQEKAGKTVRDRTVKERSADETRVANVVNEATSKHPDYDLKKEVKEGNRPKKKGEKEVKEVKNTKLPESPYVDEGEIFIDVDSL